MPCPQCPCVGQEEEGGTRAFVPPSSLLTQESPAFRPLGSTGLPPAPTCRGKATRQDERAGGDALRHGSRAGAAPAAFGKHGGPRRERQRRQHDGRKSNDTGTHFKRSSGSTLPERNSGPGFGFFLFCFFLKNRKAYCG